MDFLWIEKGELLSTSEKSVSSLWIKYEKAKWNEVIIIKQ